MKFDYIIGNPPYQENGTTNNKAQALYPFFYDSAEKIASKSILISPARFLFNAGLTPKAWNHKMLLDEHVKVEKYFRNSSDVFPNTNITAGVAIVYHDSKQKFEPIKLFIPDETLRSIANKVGTNDSNSMSNIMFGGRSDLKFNNLFLKDFPNTKEHILKTLQEKHPDIKELGNGEEYEIKSSSFSRTAYAFYDEKPDDSDEYYSFLGVEKNNRVWKWAKKKYFVPRYPDHNNIDKFKVMISKADGAAGQIGKPIPARIIGRSTIAGPNTSSVPTFISIGSFDTIEEAENVAKYIKTKFVRVLVGILKTTQDITPGKWNYVPLQDFTANSDIDWSKSISEIDQQLYKKYGLNDEEIKFIETHIEEMN